MKFFLGSASTQGLMQLEIQLLRDYITVITITIKSIRVHNVQLCKKDARLYQNQVFSREEMKIEKSLSIFPVKVNIS